MRVVCENEIVYAVPIQVHIQRLRARKSTNVKLIGPYVGGNTKESTTTSLKEQFVGFAIVDLTLLVVRR